MIHDVHGRLAESMITTVFEYAGYVVVRTGCEHLIPEVGSLAARGDQLRLPRRLACMPDLLVIDSAAADSILVEVKFRKSVRGEDLPGLGKMALGVFTEWPEAVLITVVADPPVADERYQNHIKVIDMESAEALVESKGDARVWSSLPSLTSRFEGVRKRDLHKSVDEAIAGLRLWTGTKEDRANRYSL